MEDPIFISSVVSTRAIDSHFKKKKLLTRLRLDFDRTMSRHWVRNKYTDALETNPATHGIPALYDKMTPEVSFYL